MFQRFGPNLKGRDFLVGDIHGRFIELIFELMTLGFNPLIDRLFGTGDLVDRGKRCKLSRDWLGYGWFAAVMGNHDQRVAQYRTMPEAQLRKWFKRCGGGWFSILPEYERVNFSILFAMMPTVIEITTRSGRRIGIVHAECPTNDWGELEHILTHPMVDEQLVENTVNQCRWSRRRFKAKDEGWVTGIDAVYHGHTQVPHPVTLGNRHYIDTMSDQPESRFTLIELI